MTVTYRRSLRLWQRYSVETKLLGFDERAMYVELRFVRENEVYVGAIVRARFLIPPWIATWAFDSALPPARASFASDWP